ncbi:ABC transporter permease [Bradyrhizobium arachidis]|uniref:ABC transporter permease n=1 Tax=Bradyrhizobium arachidis TaxID=858423 RepID=UPI00216248FA|nr:ABC transporter permease [Bradyrhizobium arachidis]
MRPTAPFVPLLAKELREVTAGRALWTMLLLVCPLVGYSFVQAVSLYSESSATALQSPVLARSLSPLDGILVPTFGAFYVAVTLLFPFVAIRVLGQEKESGALRLLVQLPYRTSTLIAAKFCAVVAAWLMVSIPALSALALWAILGGHLAAPETLNLLFGHLLYGLLAGAIGLLAAAISDNSATAAIIALAVTIGSWVLDFTLAGRSGLSAWLAQMSLTQTLRPFEQGLLSAGLVLGTTAVIGGLAALTIVWLPPGTLRRAKIIRSACCVLMILAGLGVATQLRASVDLSKDRRNSFSPADERLLATLRRPLIIRVALAVEDPRYIDLRRNVLAKLERAVPDVTVILASERPAAANPSDDYGQIEYRYDDRTDVSRSTSPREILPLLYALAGAQPPAPGAEEYPGYPLLVSADATLLWFFGGLPLLIVLAWWRIRRLPPDKGLLAHQGVKP